MSTLAIDGRTKLVDVGITHECSSFAHDPVDLNSFYFLEVVSSTSKILWHFTWPNTVTQIANITENSQGASHTPCIAWNPATNAYHYGVVIHFNIDGQHRLIWMLDVNLSTGGKAVSSNISGAEKAGDKLYSFVSSGTLYFCTTGSAGDSYSAWSYGWRKAAGSTSVTTMTTDVGSSSEGILCEDSSNGQFIHRGANWKAVDFLNMSAASYAAPNPNCSDFSVYVPSRTFLDGNYRYFFFKSGSNQHMGRYNVSTHETNSFYIGAMSTEVMPGAFDWVKQSGYDLITYGKITEPNYTYAAKLLSSSGVFGLTNDTASIKVDENGDYDYPAKIYHLFLSGPYIYAQHSGGASGTAITRITNALYNRRGQRNKGYIIG